ncbi:DUF6710 family protein [Staphylococcus pettenkoferi]|uniref:DUF6710 family protein n=1 Tax=Staphylococcus pettenkoferi TaxID=170573 RepID=UPI00255595C9|nr:DUF6710 family protein [Staphylococcus pettenkoferi]MDK7284482.1 hypothetical protein [Staphylococcus pettenkoferi]
MFKGNLKKVETDNKGLMKVNNHLDNDGKHNENTLNQVIEKAKLMLEDNLLMTYTERHPIFNYIKVFTDYIQNQQALMIIKNGRDNISIANGKYFNTVDAYYHTFDHILFKELYNRAEIYKGDNIKVFNGKDPILMRIWDSNKIVENMKNIGSGIMDKHCYETGIERENKFKFISSNHMAKYIYPLGITMVYNGNHSIFSGLNKSEGYIEVEDIIDVSYLYNDFYFDGTYLHDLRNKKKYKICFEIGALFEIGRLMLEHKELFSKDINSII